MAAMTYTTLVSSKGTPGSILNWVGYGKVDADTVLSDCQSLIYTMLRVREMRKSWVFRMAVGSSMVALPSRFLDPIGRLQCSTIELPFRQLTQEVVEQSRFYDSSASGTFGTNPFVTGALGSGIITATDTAHGLNQESIITIAGSSALDGITPNGTFSVLSVIDADHFTFDSGGTATVGGVTGGGAAATWTADNLVQTSPETWAIWDEAMHFNGAFETAYSFRQLYFQALPLLSASSPTNFLTDRYPHLIRQGAAALSASYMQDGEAYTSATQVLSSIIQQINGQDDMSYRGADLYTETP